MYLSVLRLMALVLQPMLVNIVLRMSGGGGTNNAAVAHVGGGGGDEQRSYSTQGLGRIELCS